MTFEEKIERLRATSMEAARTKSNRIIEAHSNALEKWLSEYKESALKQSSSNIKSETTRAKHELNRRRTTTQLAFKREQGKYQSELKSKLFDEVQTLLDEYMHTQDYTALLVSYIQKALEFASPDPVIFYINPSDADKKEFLEKQTNTSLIISSEDFIGGVRAVLKERNILIDYSFQSALTREQENFVFLGGNEYA